MTIKHLSDIQPGMSIIIKDFSEDSSVYFTLTSLGILAGDQLEVIGRAPFGGPISLKHGDDTFFALRLSHAKFIIVEDLS